MRPKAIEQLQVLALDQELALVLLKRGKEASLSSSSQLADKGCSRSLAHTLPLG